MLLRIIAFGVAAGLLVGIPLSIVVVASDELSMTWGMVVGYLMMLVALSLIFVAIKRQRDEAGGGVIRFWPALGMGLAISVIAGIFYVVSWETAMAVSNLDFATTYANGIIEAQRARGASAREIARTVAEMEAFKRQYADPLFRLPMTFTEIFPVGVLVSLISAALLRNPRFLPARRPETLQAA